MSDAPAIKPKPSLTVVTKVELPLSTTEAIYLELTEYNSSGLRGLLIGGGKTSSMYVPKVAGSGVSYFLREDPEALAGLFDLVGTLANAIDGDWLVERLMAKFEERDPAVDETGLAERIKRLGVVFNLMTLHSLGHQVMQELYGFNWVAEQSSELIKQSKEWKALVKRVELAQDALKTVIPS